MIMIFSNDSKLFDFSQFTRIAIIFPRSTLTISFINTLLIEIFAGKDFIFHWLFPNIKYFKIALFEFHFSNVNFIIISTTNLIISLPKGLSFFSNLSVLLLSAARKLWFYFLHHWKIARAHLFYFSFRPPFFGRFEHKLLAVCCWILKCWLIFGFKVFYFTGVLLIARSTLIAYCTHQLVHCSIIYIGYIFEFMITQILSFKPLPQLFSKTIQLFLLKVFRNMIVTLYIFLHIFFTYPLLLYLSLF